MSKSNSFERVIVAAVVAVAAHAAMAGEYTVTTNDGAVVFSNTTGDRKTITNPYLAADGIVSLEFNSPQGGFTFRPKSPSTYSGGTAISRGQVFVSRSESFGPGQVTIGDSSSIMVDGYNVAFDNKMIFNDDYSYIVGYNGGSVTLKSIGAVGSKHRVRIGRTGAGAASVATLSLTDANSEAVGRIQTSGDLDLTLDGGTIAVRSDAESPFFNSATSGDTPRATISPAGVAFDVAAGADVELGLSPVFRRDMMTNVLDVVAIGDFESGMGGWSVDQSGNTMSNSDRKTNGSSFDTNEGWCWTTTNETHYYMLRVNHKLSREITVPSDGLWRVVFDQGCRPGSNYYSINMNTIVSVRDQGSTIGSTTFEGPASQDSRYGFKRFETAPMNLSEGVTYTLEVALVRANPDDTNKSMNFDVFRLEKVEETGLSDAGRLTKRGGGTLRTGAWTDADVAVEAGTLKVESAVVSNSVVSVTGGTLDLTDVRLDGGSTINVAAGGTLAINPVGLTDLVVNGSFEADGQRKNIVAMNPTGWTVGKTQSTDRNTNGSGLQGNGGNVSESGPTTPDAPSTAYLREYSTLSQTVSVTESGYYRLSFLKACRSTLYSYSIPVTVTVGGKTVFESTENSIDEYEQCSADVYLEAADHAITFTTGCPSHDTEGSMVFIDDVRLNLLKDQGELSGGTVNMASGSTLSGSGRGYCDGRRLCTIR